MLPFWPLYLQSIGMTAGDIGVLMAVLMTTRIVSPIIWGKLGDSVPRRMLVVQWGSFAAALIFVGVFFTEQMHFLVWVVAGYSFFWNAVLPQFEVITLNHLGDHHHRYSQVRVWGSVGFIGAAVGLGWYFNTAPISHVPALLFGCFVALWLLSLSIASPEQKLGEQHSDAPLSVLFNRPFIGFMLACLLLQLAHGPYYTYFSLYVESAGYNKTQTGVFWALGAVSEMFVFMLMHRILPRFGAVVLFQWALALSVIRWVLLDQFVGSLAMLLIVQLLHAGTFGLFHASSIELLRQHVPVNLSGQGQALYSMISYGVGGALGALVSSVLWPMNPSYAFWMASIASIIALLISRRLMVNQLWHHASGS